MGRAFLGVSYQLADGWYCSTGRWLSGNEEGVPPENDREDRYILGFFSKKQGFRENPLTLYYKKVV